MPEPATAAQMGGAYTASKARKLALEAEHVRCGQAMDNFPRGPMNLTPDSVKATAEFIAARRAYQVAFAQLRSFNASFVRTYKAEISAERREWRVNQ